LVFWEWLAYATVFVSALTIAADAGVRSSPELQEYFWFMHSAAWGFAPLILLVAGAIILIARDFGWVGGSRRRTRPDLTNPSADFPTPNWHEPLEPVVNKEFRNQEVELDGKNFVDCRFINVTFRYNGTMPIQFSNCTLPVGEYILQADNPVVMVTHELVDALRTAAGERGTTTRNLSTKPAAARGR
jgi:hypothetical protein